MKLTRTLCVALVTLIAAFAGNACFLFDSDETDVVAGGGSDTAVSFQNGGASLEATTVGDGNKKTTTVTHNGETVVVLEVTLAGTRAEFPTVTDQILETDFYEDFESMPSDFATNRLGAFMAGWIVAGSEAGLMEDNPGCDWFPDTRCTLHCCYNHDVCFAQNSCSASSWVPFVGSTACKNCNSVAQGCILRACAYGLEGDPSQDECFDAACNVHYTCPNSDDDCECEHGCGETPSGCGNGTCEVDEDAQNCAADCATGLGVNICCLENGNCPSELPDSCPGSCCCCGMGEVCGTGHVCVGGK